MISAGMSELQSAFSNASHLAGGSGPEVGSWLQAAAIRPLHLVTQWAAVRAIEPEVTPIIHHACWSETRSSKSWQLGGPRRIPGRWWRTWRRWGTAGSELNGFMRHLETIQRQTI